jgi:hypothetical protein
MVKVTIELDEDEYSEFVKRVGDNAPRDAILKALGIKNTSISDHRSAEIAWKLMKKSRDEAERQYYELLQASLASEDGIAVQHKYWCRGGLKQTLLNIPSV